MKKFPKQYTKGLSDKDKVKQIKQLTKSSMDYEKGLFTGRKKLESFKGKKSQYVEKFTKKTGIPVNIDKIADKFSKNPKRKKNLKEGMEQVIKKAKGAYYSAGSRPNQTPSSWSKARLASVLVGGPARKIDKNIVDKYNLPKI